MRAFWTNHAQHDLATIGERIREEDEEGAFDVVRALLQVAGKLPGAPASGEPGRVPDTRELALGGGAYKMVFQVLEDRITVLRILHLA